MSGEALFFSGRRPRTLPFGIAGEPFWRRRGLIQVHPARGAPPNLPAAAASLIMQGCGEPRLAAAATAIPADPSLSFAQSSDGRRSDSAQAWPAL